MELIDFTYHILDDTRIDTNRAPKIIKAIQRNEGYCPCYHPELESKDTKCPCKTYLTKHECTCGLYIKKEQFKREKMEVEEFKKEFEVLGSKINESLKYFKEIVETHTKGLIFEDVITGVQLGESSGTESDIIHLSWSLKEATSGDVLNLIRIQHKCPISLRSKESIESVVNIFMHDIYWLFLLANDASAENAHNIGSIIKTTSWKTIKEKYGR